MFDKTERSSFKYWFAHWCSFNMVALNQKCWKFKYLFHDMEKPFLKLILPYKTLQKFHRFHNKHHPEYWTYVDEYYKPVVLDMPPIYIAEMLLDHQAMGYKFGDNAYNYYQKTKDKKPYSDKTKKIIESVIDIFNK